ncbi:Lysosomal alpha-glucosidase [Toxocara canis]|uniref:Lysosomal alpha-glucosidase n=1 Tax=Toxocara canis TaxID=6265 RepID=A0A0B2UQN7_TOXCA|nr:Lysosomal alpha-glucosidase [Toxocara canis]
MLGVVWPDRHVAFPDFLDPQNKTQAWWMKEITTLHTSVDYDGIWIDMNEPANFGTNEDNPWYWEQKQLAPLKCPLSGEHSKFDSPPYPTINAYQWGLSFRALSAISARFLYMTYDGANSDQCRSKPSEATRDFFNFGSCFISFFAQNPDNQRAAGKCYISKLRPYFLCTENRECPYDDPTLRTVQQPTTCYQLSMFPFVVLRSSVCALGCAVIKDVVYAGDYIKEHEEILRHEEHIWSRRGDCNANGTLPSNRKKRRRHFQVIASLPFSL